MNSLKSLWLLLKSKFLSFWKVFVKKCNSFYATQVKITIYEIVLAGILVGLFLISDRFINFNLGFMHIGIYYAFVILIGLTLKPFHAFFVAIIADTFGTLITVGFAQWMIEYAVIYPLMALSASLFQQIINSQKRVLWGVFISANLAVIIGTIVTMIVKSNFVKQSKNSESFFDFTSDISKIVTSVMASLLILTSVILVSLYVLAQKGKVKIEAKRLKTYMLIYSLIIILYIVFVWLWGPIAQIRYNMLYINHRSFSENAKNSYELFLIARILKTPFAVIVYTMIVTPIYESNRIIRQHFNGANKWQA